MASRRTSCSECRHSATLGVALEFGDSCAGTSRTGPGVCGGVALGLVVGGGGSKGYWSCKLPGRPEEFHPAHRTVRKPLDLHGSSQPFACRLAMTVDAESRTLLPIARLATTLLELGHPLRSTLITSASSLLLDDPPPSCPSVMSPFVFRTYRVSLGIA